MHVQNGIASDIADWLRVRLSGKEKVELGGSGTKSPEAYQLYLKARYLLARNTEEDDLEARRLFLQALDKDSTFVEGHLGLASVYARSAGNGYVPPAEGWTLAEQEAHKALQLEPGNVRARAVLAARLLLYKWDWPAASSEFDALSGDPRLFLGYAIPSRGDFLLGQWSPR